MKESDVKYLAGLYDADGSASIGDNGSGSIYLRLSVAASDAVSPNHKILYWLRDTFGGSVRQHAQLKNSVVCVWIVRKRSDLERLVPRLLKHLVIKGNALAGLWNLYQTYRGRTLDEDTMSWIRETAKSYRYGLSGPVKPKKHPTTAWVAGYIDGDGSFKNRYYAKYNSHHLRVTVTAHVKDRVGLDLLHKAYGGKIYHKKTEPNVLTWTRNLGPRDKSFATRWLPRLIGHLKIKRYKAEQILAIHSQRLSEETPTGEAIVQAA